MVQRSKSRRCRFMNSQPSITGIIRSSRIKSGRGPFASSASASRPFCASTTSKPVDDRSAVRVRTRANRDPRRRGSAACAGKWPRVSRGSQTHARSWSTDWCTAPKALVVRLPQSAFQVSSARGYPGKSHDRGHFAGSARSRTSSRLGSSRHTAVNGTGHACEKVEKIRSPKGVRDTRP